MGPNDPKSTVTGQPPDDDSWDASTPTQKRHPDGQAKDHWVLTPEERAKGFVRPVRESYLHAKCGTITTMPRSIAETYAARPTFYGQTFCCGCNSYLPVGAAGDFTWKGTDEKVGT